MNALESFSLSDIADVDKDPDGFVRPVRETEDAAEKRSRVHCVRWARRSDVVVLKEVHLWAEDTVTCDVHTTAAHISELQASTRGTHTAAFFVQYLAVHIDTPHHYQWLLSCCGPPLKVLLGRSTAHPCFDEARCKLILRCVLTALNHLHTVCGFVHGDVSLGNIFTSLSFDSDSHVVLGDLEALAPLGATPAGSPGTLLYTSPERLRDSSLPCSAHDDIWAFGVVAYQLLTGSSCKAHPWCRDRTGNAVPDNFWALLDAMDRVRDTPSLQCLQETPLAMCSHDALRVVAACLSWQPAERPAASALLQHPWFDMP
jgi:hypothetical protein